jgi:putative GTP pyrophosphokinase
MLPALELCSLQDRLMKNIIPDEAALRCEYEADYSGRHEISKELEIFLERLLAPLPSHYTIKVRVKSFASFYRKYLRYMREKYGGEPAPAPVETDGQCGGETNRKITIPDEIGIRIICPFLGDIETAETIVAENFSIVEIEKKGEGYSFKEFGYESLHILVEIPPAIGEKYKKTAGGSFTGEIAEIQIRTILQEAWAEVEHEFVYKAEFTPFGAPMRRKLAAINASLSLADTIFQEFRAHQRQLDEQLTQRRVNFFKQVESVVDSFLDNGTAQTNESEYHDREMNTSSIDDLLLNALYAHNKGRFKQAEIFYSRILSLNPDKKIKAMIFKHRGMAHFAQSKYVDAINDFEESFATETTDSASYLLGVVHSCLKDYDAAITNFNKSLEINPHQKYCFFRRAQDYYHINDYPAALSDCEAAIALDSKFESAKKLKTLLMKKLEM